MRAEAAGLLADLQAAGFTVRLHDGQLLVRPASALPPDARAILAAHRDAIAAVLVEAAAVRELVEEIARLRGWSEAERIEALAVAARWPQLDDWQRLAELVRASVEPGSARC